MSGYESPMARAIRRAGARPPTDRPTEDIGKSPPSVQLYIRQLEAALSKERSDAGWKESARHAERSGGTQ